jgi:hypothetical protein
MKPVKVLHWAIIIVLLQEFLYAGYMVFFQVGGGGPLFGRVGEISFELVATRRLYAIEAWIAFGALAIYLGITEVAPRLWSNRQDAPAVRQD